MFGDSNIHYLGQKFITWVIRGSTKVVNIHYLGQIQNLGQNNIITVIVGWVGGGEERRLWQNEQPTSFWCGCQPVKVIRPCRSMVFAKVFVLHSASLPATTTNNSRQCQARSFLIDSPPRLISQKTTSII